MNEFLIAILLGIVEGLTEFIPVSSTAHLVIMAELLEFRAPPGHVFEVFIQLGAILAIVFLYRKKLWDTAVKYPHDKVAQRFVLNLALGTVPALVVGAIGRDWIKTHLYNPAVIGTALIVGGLIILLLEKKLIRISATTVDDVTPKTAFIVGCCQSVALIPGISRSGATIMGSLACGLSRPAAAEFSFFLAIPVMMAAVAYDTIKGWESITAYGHFSLMMTGLLAAFFTALLVVKLAVGIISRYGFSPFAWYRIAAGIAVLVIFY